MNQKQSYIQLLHDTGLKATKTRLQILNILMNLKKPQNIVQMKKKIKEIDKVTLYRTMNIFVKKGIVRPVHVCGNSKFFELTVLPHHHHIVCKKCGTIEDIDECDLKHVIGKMKKKSVKFNIIKEHTFELFGICKKCENI